MKIQVDLIPEIESMQTKATNTVHVVIRYKYFLSSVHLSPDATENSFFGQTSAASLLLSTCPLLHVLLLFCCPLPLRCVLVRK